MEVVLKITLQVEPNKDGKEFFLEELQETAKEAINETLNHASNRGFNHPLAHEVSIGVGDISIINGEDYPDFDEGYFVLSNDADGNDFEELEADNWQDAYIEALGMLGYHVGFIEKDSDDEDDEDSEDNE